MSAASVQPDFWRGKKVFLTGHTGFKGGWLCLMLARLGALVHGYALPPPTEPNLFTLARIEETLASHRLADVRDRETLAQAVRAAAPDIVIHMAAQPLLRLSYEVPVETYATNIMGTVHLLEAVRHAPTVRVAVNVTSDKCYENRETAQSFREDDPMGGHDPYSSSKGCAELVTAAYGRSFFTDGRVALASVRAGNVIGGGDWARDRLVPDMIAALIAGHAPLIRNPHAVRPWQHVLEPLSGYLRAAQRLWDAPPAWHPEAWNFGPDAEGEANVTVLADTICRLWGGGARWQNGADSAAPHEAHMLKLDSAKARRELGWHPRWPLPVALAETVVWYKSFGDGADMRAVTLAQIASYENAAA